MSIIIKTADEIEKMIVAGKLAADVLEMIAPHVVAGVTTNKLDEICHDYIVNEQQAIPAPLNYHGFPKSICTSINQQVCHGIPSDKALKKATSLILILPSSKRATTAIPARCFILASLASKPSAFAIFLTRA